MVKCENYFIVNNIDASCGELEDYKEINGSPKKYFEKLGYRKIDGKWYCSKCAEKLKKQSNT